MEDAISKLKALRDKKSAKISHLQSEMDECEMAIRELTGQLEGINEALAAISSNNSSGLQVSSLQIGTGKYINLKPTEAVFEVVNTFGTAPGLLVPEILEKLSLEGFKSGAKELYPMIYSISQRLVKSGKIKESKKNGKRSFMKN